MDHLALLLFELGLIFSLLALLSWLARRLGTSAIPLFLVAGIGEPDGLQSDEAADQRIPGKIDDSHRPLAELPNDFKTAKDHDSLSSPSERASRRVRGAPGSRSPALRNNAESALES